MTPCLRLMPVLLSLLAVTACSAANDAEDAAAPLDRPEAPAGEAERASGTLAFELKTSGEITLNAFDYTVTGPNFVKTGTIDVSKSNTVSTRIDALPGARGYTITVLGSSVEPPVAQCSGAASFDITPRSVTHVPIAISCRVAHGDPPVAGVAAPVPRQATWLCGLALLGVGVALVGRAGSKRLG